MAATVAPIKDTPESAFYNAEQSALLLQALDKEPLKWRAYFYLALFSQLRRGELIALTWDDIDLEQGVVLVNKSSYYSPEKGVVLKAPKSASGYRQVTIPHTVCEVLKEHRSDQRLQRLRAGADWQDANAVFTQRNGLRLNLDSPAARLKKIVKRSGLPPISPHGLRHTGASLLVAGGEDYKTVQYRLGHSRASTTLDLYAHFLKHRDQEASSKLDSIITRARSKAI